MPLRDELLCDRQCVRRFIVDAYGQSELDHKFELQCCFEESSDEIFFIRVFAFAPIIATRRRTTEV